MQKEFLDNSLVIRSIHHLRVLSPRTTLHGPDRLYPLQLSPAAGCCWYWFLLWVWSTWWLQFRQQAGRQSFCWSAPAFLGMQRFLIGLSKTEKQSKRTLINAPSLLLLLWFWTWSLFLPYSEWLLVTESDWLPGLLRGKDMRQRRETWLTKIVKAHINKVIERSAKLCPTIYFYYNILIEEQQTANRSVVLYVCRKPMEIESRTSPT